MDLNVKVPAFIGKSIESIEETENELLNSSNLDIKGYTNLDSLLKEHSINALIIASPFETHSLYLREAIRHNLHVLCEKPFIWGEESPISETLDIVKEFEKKNLILMENTQWPYTLKTYSKLFPKVEKDPRRLHGS